MLTPPVPSLHDFQSLARLRQDAQRHDPAALKEATVQFEALIVGMLLKTSREASLGEGIFDNAQSQQYLELMDQQVAMELARNGGLGFGKLLVEGLKDVWGPGETQPELANPGQFVSHVMDVAADAARRLGVDPELLVAQSALETGWGRSVPKHPDGRPTFNFFGIKADANWRGPRVARNTLEFVAGIPEQRRAQFRAYSTPEEGFRDYAQLVQNSPRYSGAVGAKDSEAYARELANGGYATDPDYADKWLAIYHGDTLKNAVQEFKSTVSESTH